MICYSVACYQILFHYKKKLQNVPVNEVKVVKRSPRNPVPLPWMSAHVKASRSSTSIHFLRIMDIDSSG